MFNAVLASPRADFAIASRASPSIRMFRFPSPLSGSAIARVSMVTRSSSCRGWSTNTWHRDNRAALISKDGFSVVAPKRAMSPPFDERQERVLLGLVEPMEFVHEEDGRSPRYSRNCLASSKIRRMSFTPESTAEKVTRLLLDARAAISARVVFPAPGGPHSSMERGLSVSAAFRNTASGDTRWACPTNSSQLRGRIRSARGASPALFFSAACSKRSITVSRLHRFLCHKRDQSPRRETILSGAVRPFGVR